MTANVACTECFKVVTVNLGSSPIKCPECGEAMRCHSCGSDTPEYQWEVAPSVDSDGVWCGLECVGRSAISG